MSLRLKIAAALALLAGLIGALAATGAYVTAERQLDSGIDDTLLTRAQSAITPQGPFGRNRPGPGGQQQQQQLLRCPTAAELQSLEAAQLLSDGKVVACVDGGNTITPTDDDWALADSGDEGTYRLHDARVHGERVRVITMASEGGAVQLARDLGESERVLDGLQDRLLLIGLAGIVVAAMAGFALATQLVRPVRRLTRTAEHIAATRDLSTPIPGGSGGRAGDEIGSLAASFTTMVGSLAESQDQQQRLISDASHEMRTPLTSLRTNLELLERAERTGAGPLSAEDRRAVIDDLQFETAELTALLTELVELATDRSSDEPFEPVDLTAVGRSVVERARRRTGRDIEVVTPAGVPTAGVEGRPPMLERATSNLVDNAVKYSPVGTPITVTVTPTRIEVRDRGAGIAPDDLPRVFDRFYRATSARTEPGSGLGLAIVSQIVEAHGGRVFAANAPDGGAIVGFELPPMTG